MQSQKLTKGNCPLPAYLSEPFRIFDISFEVVKHIILLETIQIRDPDAQEALSEVAEKLKKVAADCLTLAKGTEESIESVLGVCLF